MTYIADITRGCGDLLRKVPGLHATKSAAIAAAKKLHKGGSVRVREATEGDICECGCRAIVGIMCDRCFGAGWGE